MVILWRLALAAIGLLGVTALMPVASSVTGATMLNMAAYADDNDDNDDDGVRRRRQGISLWQRPGRPASQRGRGYRDGDDDRVGNRRSHHLSRDRDDDDD
jgi:hypothetical protein